MARSLVLHFDGSCQIQQVGPASYGFSIRDESENLIGDGNGLVFSRENVPITNNVAEWDALQAGLEWIIDNGISADRLIIRGDSMLVIKQLIGRWKCKSRHLRQSLSQCHSLLRYLTSRGRIGEWTAEWIPRAENDECDGLADMAYSMA